MKYLTPVDFKVVGQMDRTGHIFNDAKIEKKVLVACKVGKNRLEMSIYKKYF